MNTSYIALIVLLIVLWIQRRNEKVWLKKFITSRGKGGRTEMKRLAERFINKECIIYTFNSQLEATIKEVSESALLIERDGGAAEAVNLDFVVRLREHPRKKNGKKKSVVFD